MAVRTEMEALAPYALLYTSRHAWRESYGNSEVDQVKAVYQLWNKGALFEAIIAERKLPPECKALMELVQEKAERLKAGIQEEKIDLFISIAMEYSGPKFIELLSSNREKFPVDRVLGNQMMKLFKEIRAQQLMLKDEIEVTEEAFEAVLHSVEKHSGRAFESMILSDGKKLSDYLSKDQMETLCRDSWKDARCYLKDRISKAKLKEVPAPSPSDGPLPLAYRRYLKSKGKLPASSSSSNTQEQRGIGYRCTIL